MDTTDISYVCTLVVVVVVTDIVEFLLAFLVLFNTQNQMACIESQVQNIQESNPNLSLSVDKDS